MEPNFIISPRVVNTIKSLPTDQQVAITTALANDLILGIDPMTSLSPMQGVVYSIIRFYVKQDTQRTSKALRCS